ncbi:hypothetical protein HMPREF0653_02577 [Prevotella disiens JCM 6334 = ATCC 29426]|uniref:Uncharacterized protein n=1 Tax=Prevotella disiens JCM 6334 = ATCC 29426 TaxID=1235811 RepID=A0ABN0NNT8_9BACT|nr:hypothetical protein HMPREF0653_02577 [Prevotella disiens JCM 6334 = ATCC 29426]
MVLKITIVNRLRFAFFCLFIDTNRQFIWWIVYHAPSFTAYLCSIKKLKIGKLFFRPHL